MSSVEIVHLKNGEAAVRHLASGQIMHAGTGPRVEPQEIYAGPSRVAERLQEGGDGPLVVLDIGLGGAANALAAWEISEAAGPQARRLEIVSFENDLEALALVLSDRASFAMSPEARAAATELLANHQHETPRTTWRLLFGDLRDGLASLPAASADIVFWDVYSGTANPHLWTVDTFRGARRVARDGATLHTFSTATSARSAMLLAGFAVGVGVATGNKAQTTVAATHHSLLASPLDARWLARLERSSAPFPPDIEDRQAAFADIRRAPQFT